MNSDDAEAMQRTTRDPRGEGIVAIIIGLAVLIGVGIVGFLIAR